MNTIPDAGFTTEANTTYILKGSRDNSTTKKTSSQRKNQALRHGYWLAFIKSGPKFGTPDSIIENQLNI